ncbi:MAG: MFS transporter [Jatrophihabitantaceae bacterium]
MSSVDVAAGVTRVRDWFHREVERRLEKAVGGSARLRVIALLAAVLGLSSADSATVGAIAAPLEASLHIGNTQLGLLVTLSTAIGAVATLPVGVAVDRVRRVRLLAIAIVIWSVAMIVSALSVSYLMLLLTRVALGVVVATAGPAVASLTGDFFSPAERGRVYGYILSGELLGAGAGILISGDIAGVLSWRASFAWLAIPGLALAWAIWRRLPEPDRGGQSRLDPGATEIVAAEDVDTEPAEEPEHAPEGAQAERDAGPLAEEVERAGVAPHPERVLHTDSDTMPLRRAVHYILSIRTNVVLIIGSALGYFFFAGLRTFGVEFARGRFGLGQSAASSLLVLIGAGAVVGVLSGGRIADRLIGRGTLAGRPIVAGVGFLLAAALFLPGLLVPELLLALPLLLLAAAAYSATNPPLDAARLDVMQHHLWGRAEAVRTVLRSLLEAAAPLVFGYVSGRFGGPHGGLSGATGASGSTVAAAGSHGLDVTFLIMLAPLAVSAVLLLTAARKTYPRDVATALASERNTAHAGHD